MEPNLESVVRSLPPSLREAALQASREELSYVPYRDAVRASSNAQQAEDDIAVEDLLEQLRSMELSPQAANVDKRCPIIMLPKELLVSILHRVIVEDVVSVENFGMVRTLIQWSDQNE